MIAQAIPNQLIGDTFVIEGQASFLLAERFAGSETYLMYEISKRPGSIWNGYRDTFQKEKYRDDPLDRANAALLFGQYEEEKTRMGAIKSNNKGANAFRYRYLALNP